MWRPFFLALGVSAVLFGVECLGVEKMVLKARHEAPARAVLFFDTTPQLGPNKEFAPPPWLPWSALVTGAVICLYALQIPQRLSGGGK
jgi:hypothetical protein